VEDVERALAFYRDLLGLPQSKTFPAEDGSLRSAWLDASGVVVMLEKSLRGAGPADGSGHVLALAIPDLGAFEERLAGAGVAVEDRTAHTLFVRDPDGHRVGFSSFRFEPAAPGAGPDHFRRLETERAGREQAQALMAATQALTATLSLRQVLDTILRELAGVVPYDTASVQELRGERMVIVGGHGFDLDAMLGRGFDAVKGDLPNRDVLEKRIPVIVDDILGAHGYSQFPSADHAASGVRSWLGVPLVFGSECIGMLTLDKREVGYYDRGHAEVVSSFAAQAAIAIENARLYEQTQHELQERKRAEEELRGANERLKGQLAEIEELQARLREQAIRDPLTGLFNRRYLTETLERELARASREGLPLSVVMIDVDHFKALNDAFGHRAGDLMLLALGNLLSAQTRHGDIACRYGGEEFVVVLPGAPVEKARSRAEVWRSAFQEMRVAFEKAELRATLSLGLAAFPLYGTSGDDLLRLADKALYAAKRRGRNRLVVSGSEEDTEP
jgi:diguanylate cyclase (GGDEF)-like protein